MPFRRRRPLMRMAATTAVVAGTATAVSGHMQRHQAAKDQQAAEAQAYEQQQAAPQYAEPAPAYAPPPAPPAPASGGLTMEALDQLKELAALKDSGVLTEAEFEVQKAKILA